MLPAPYVQDGLTISPFEEEQRDERGAVDHIPDNGKVERSHRSDEQEFHQLLSYNGDVDLEAKLVEWERFYNFGRSHGASNGQTPYEALREKL